MFHSRYAEQLVDLILFDQKKEDEEDRIVFIWKYFHEITSARQWKFREKQ